MRRWLRPVLVSAIAVLAPTQTIVRSANPAGTRVPVVVELFTSEGCSSCPPADALLAELDRTQPVAGAQVIALEEHVDYWNSDGWRDPFSSAEYTTRQQEYARRLGIAGPYTPEMVVAGRTDVVGSSSSDAYAAIAAAAQVPQVGVALAVTREGVPDTEVRASVEVDALPADAGESAEAYLALTEDGLASDVNAGENAGRRMEHRAVVRRLIPAGQLIPGKRFTANVDSRIAPGWKRENLRVVVFVGGSRSGKILGAAIAPAGK